MSRTTIAFTALLLFLSSFFSLDASATVPPKYEMRGVWLTTAFGLDWPKRAARSLEDERRQQESLRGILDELQTLGINTVFLQVRGRGDLIYPSAIEPMSLYVAEAGYQLRYDPLAFAIEEANKRGMAVHAWLVVLPLGDDRYLKGLPDNAFAKKHRAHSVKFGKTWYMDPTSPQTSIWLSRIIQELLEKYKVAGIHLDYIRYPDKNLRFPDQKRYKQLAKAGQTLAEWREENINRLVGEISRAIKESKQPEALLSAAVLPAYRELPGERWLGWTCKAEVHQDPIAWAEAGHVDFIVPMMYNRQERFYPFVEDWGQLSPVPVVMGLGAYRVLKNEGAWEMDEVVRQTTFVQQHKQLAGVCYFRAEQLLSPSLGLRVKLGELPSLQRAALPFKRPNQSLPDAEFTLPIEVEEQDEGLFLTWKGESEQPLLYLVSIATNGASPDPLSGKHAYRSSVENSVLVPWHLLDEEDLLTVEVERYDLHRSTLQPYRHRLLFYRSPEPK